MLTRKYILRVARLLDQTGEPRPGYDEEIANLKGSNPLLEFSNGNINGTKAQSAAMVNICLSYDQDPATGDVRIVKRQ